MKLNQVKMVHDKRIPIIHLKSGSPLGEALKKMVEHKRLRERVPAPGALSHDTAHHTQRAACAPYDHSAV